MTKSPPVLHIFAQQHEHDDCFIVGNRDALIKLRYTIDQVLNSETNRKTDATNLFTTDGEGFNCFVVLNDDDWQEKSWGSLLMPYAKLDTEMHPAGGHAPVMIMGDGEYMRIVNRIKEGK
jgi:hypothetical protein